VRVTLQIKKGDSKEVSSVLTTQTGKEIQFVPRKVDDRFNLDLKDSPLFNALDSLSKRGRITINGTDFGKFQKLRTLMLRGGKVSIDFKNVPAKDAVDKLSFLSGLSFSVTSGNAGATVSISAQDVTLNEIVTRIMAQTGVKIEKTGEDTSSK
jgi:hypothetical protein